MKGRRIPAGVTSIGLLLALLAVVQVLPPDTSFSEMKKSGVLKVCVPPEYPPLVTRDPQAPGIGVELASMVADRLGVRMALNEQSAMGADWNPRNWRVTRAQCQVLGGGVVDSITTRSFLVTTRSYLETGWALLLPGDVPTLEGASVGFFAGVSGLDRIELSRFLRDQGAQVVPLDTADDLAAGLADGRFTAGVTEALLARRLGEERHWRVQWLPGLERQEVVLGLWKGDLTLKRGVNRAIQAVQASGDLARVMRRYRLAPIEEECIPCR